VSQGFVARLFLCLLLMPILATAWVAPLRAAQPVLSCPSGTTVFDWDTPANSWIAGTLNNSYAVSNIGTINYAITTTGGTWVTNATYGGTAPFRQNIDTYGMSPVQYTLQEWIDFSTNTQTATTTITLPTAVPGLQFSIFDVDFSSGGFTDRIVVTGSFNGSPVTANLATHNATPSYTISGNVATGTATSAVNSMNGRIWVTFSSPVDRVTVIYGNAPSAPANPSSQAIDFHDITFCRPVANVTATKISSILSDGVSGSNPKSVPGAVVRYCITVQNSGSGTATNFSIADPLPANVTYVANSLTSGATCGTAATAEDDDNADGGEVDNIRMHVSGLPVSTVNGTAITLGPSATFALAFSATIN
jgi:uncharacterized repeat protein (TIGR01451 family)